ncbi:MAG: DUF2752 domain-containing protein [Planctomycetes bacterium]|nr:DUF2752 domain-containing protein [Planctomycetota bacterium]
MYSALDDYAPIARPVAPSELEFRRPITGADAAGHWVPLPADVTGARRAAAVVLAGALTILFVGTQLQPDARGLGTHQQLGLAPCALVTVLGYPCPTCGLTTSVAYAVRGRLLASFQAHPAGLALVMTLGAAAALALQTLMTGRVPSMAVRPSAPLLLAVSALALLLGGWGYKLILGLYTGALPLR